MKYYSAVKKNEILPLAETLMDLGRVKCFSGALVVKRKKPSCRRQEMFLAGAENTDGSCNVIWTLGWMASAVVSGLIWGRLDRRATR